MDKNVKKLFEIYKNEIIGFYGEQGYEEIKNSDAYNFCYVAVKPMYANNTKREIPYILGRIGALDLQILDARYVQYDEEHGAAHYAAHKGKPFYDGLLDYITSDIAYGIVVFGNNALAKIDANKKDIRNQVLELYPELDGEEKKTKNVIHASDCVEAAATEIEIFQDLVAQKENKTTV